MYNTTTTGSSLPLYSDIINDNVLLLLIHDDISSQRQRDEKQNIFTLPDLLFGFQRSYRWKSMIENIIQVFGYFSFRTVEMKCQVGPACTYKTKLIHQKRNKKKWIYFNSCLKTYYYNYDTNFQHSKPKTKCPVPKTFMCHLLSCTNKLPLGNSLKKTLLLH